MLVIFGVLAVTCWGAGADNIANYPTELTVDSANFLSDGGCFMWLHDADSNYLIDGLPVLRCTVFRPGTVLHGRVYAGYLKIAEAGGANQNYKLRTYTYKVEIQQLRPTQRVWSPSAPVLPSPSPASPPSAPLTVLPDAANESRQSHQETAPPVLPPISPLPPGAFGIPNTIGNGVSAPSILSKTEPTYTEEARAARLQGTVVLSLVVDEQGRPQNITVARPLSNGLDQSAVQAVQQWRFNPGMKDGKAVPVIATIEVDFRLLD
ncbi:MAG TPA: energy transducer TonB [Bryobacteraceae bacterium]|nr:energy transducer TonB [Bryobacteraceae bacterium]